MPFEAPRSSGCVCFILQLARKVATQSPSSSCITAAYCVAYACDVMHY
uniref:Uncharacterized protein n=1 Tax=Arundo donax TaxID=35708 RepID=A0A0A9HD61_ARUDO